MTHIAFIAPSSANPDDQSLDRAAAYFTALGWRVTAPDAVWAKHQRFAGTDEERVAALMAVVADKSVDVVMSTRGGYGLSRLLPAIKWKKLAASGKAFVGLSDFTALNLALWAQTGYPSFQGPYASMHFGQETISSFTEEHFLSALAGESSAIEFAGLLEGAPGANPNCEVTGRLWGGNLTVLMSLIGTPYFPSLDQTKRGILFVEDVSEHPYRIERMFLQLKAAGVLDQQRAIILGRFTHFKLAEHDNGYDLAEAVKVIRSLTKVPVLVGLPLGHVPDVVTIPVGAMAQVSSKRGKVHVQWVL
jgi:muramoyltetrapeptide carboxypeptidase